MDDENSGTVSSDIDDLETISAYTWDKMKRSMCGAGFREGSSAGWDLAFQTGFDCGYAQGYSDGYLLGILKGIMSVGGHEVAGDGTVVGNVLKKPSAGMCQWCSDSGISCEDFSKLATSQELFSQAVLKDLVEKYSDVLKEHDVVLAK